MFRLLRLRRNVTSLGARLYSTTSPQPQIVQVQRVRFRKKRPKASTIVFTLGSSYMLYHVIFRTLIVVDDEDSAEISEDERREIEEAAEKPIFIPFPGFTLTVDSRPFRGSDPEWQAYVKVSKNPALLNKMRDTMAEWARRVLIWHPKLRPTFGPDAKVTQYWLDVEYPYKPPPTFVRQGLLFGDGQGIAWAQMPVESRAVFQTRQALWPSAVASSLWSFTSALMTQNAMLAAKFLGYESRIDPWIGVHQTIEKLQQATKDMGAGGSPPSAVPPLNQKGEGSGSSPMTPIDKRPAGTTTTPETLGTGADVSNTTTMPSAKDMYMVRMTQEHTSGPWDTLKKTLAQKWRRPTAYPPRGAIRVSGLVEVGTPRAFVTFDCIGWWDPQTESFDPRTTGMRIRSIRPKVQTAMR